MGKSDFNFAHYLPTFKQTNLISMHALTYESRALRGLPTEEIHNILQTATKFNSENDISGCLIYHNQQFIQVLEGEKEGVQELFARIRLDSRHKNIRLISEDTIEERTFPRWGMAFCPLDDKEASHSEVLQFRNNMKLLYDFSEPTSVTVRIFWKKVKFLISQPPN